MAEKRSKEPREKKKGGPVVRKVVGSVTLVEDQEAKEPGPPTYEHG